MFDPTIYHLFCSYPHKLKLRVLDTVHLDWLAYFVSVVVVVVSVESFSKIIHSWGSEQVNRTHKYNIHFEKESELQDAASSFDYIVDKKLF